MGLAVKVGLAGRLDAEGVGAEVYCIGILRQDLVFGEEEFELVGRDPLFAFQDEHLQSRDVAQQTSGVFASCAEEVLGQLLRDGGGAACIVMQGIVFQCSRKGLIVDAVMTVESLVFRVDEGFPEDGVHLFVGHGRTVLTEEFAYQLSVGTVDHRGFGRTFVLDGRHGGRLSEEPEEVYIHSQQIEEEEEYDTYHKRQPFDIPRAPLIESFIPGPKAFHF